MLLNCSFYFGNELVCMEGRKGEIMPPCLVSIALLCSIGNYSGPPHVLFNTSQSNPQEGMPFTLQCLTAPDTNTAITWLRGGQELQPSNGITLSKSHELFFETFTSIHTGNYTCAVVDEGEIVTMATIDLQLSGYFRNRKVCLL